jgi:hypothetical protein
LFFLSANIVVIGHSVTDFIATTASAAKPEGEGSIMRQAW